MKACAKNTAAILFAVAFLLAIPSRLDAAIEIPLPPPAIDRQAGVLLNNLRAGRLDTAENALIQLIEMRKQAGIPNLTPVAAAFVGYFDNGTVEATSKKKRQILETAIELAPDYPALWFKLARVRLFQGPSNFGPAAHIFLTGVGKLPSFPRSSTMLAAQVSFYVIGVLLILYLITGIAFISRYFPHIRHDIGDLLPNAEVTHFTAAEIRKSRGFLQSASRMLSDSLLTVLVLLVMAAPVLLGAGLIFTAAFWMFMIFPYCRTSERAMIILATVVAAMLPLGGTVTALPAHMADSAGTIRWSCIREYCPLLQQDALDSLLGDEAVTSELEQMNLEMTVVAVGTGKLQYAQADPERLAAARKFLDDHKDALVSWVGQVTMANAIVLDSLGQCTDENRPDSEMLASAMGWYRRALTQNPDAESIHRGLAVTAGLTGDRKSMEDSLQRVVDLTDNQSLDFMAQVRTLTQSAEPCRRIPAIAAELRPPRPGSDAAIYFDQMSAFDLAEQIAPLLPFKSVVIGSFTPRTLPLGLAILLMASFGILFVNTRSRRAFRCSGCGHIICPSCNRRASGFDHCPICLFEQVRPAFLDPRDIRAMTSFQRRGLSRRYWVPVTSIIVPGTGQVLDGRPFRGIAMLLLLGLGAMMVVSPSPPIVDKFAYIPEAAQGLPLLPPVLLVSAYVWSVIDVIVTRNR